MPWRRTSDSQLDTRFVTTVPRITNGYDLNERHEWHRPAAMLRASLLDHQSSHQPPDRLMAEV